MNLGSLCFSTVSDNFLRGRARRSRSVNATFRTAAEITSKTIKLALSSKRIRASYENVYSSLNITILWIKVTQYGTWVATRDGSCHSRHRSAVVGSDTRLKVNSPGHKNGRAYLNRRNKKLT
jgi:hypothetical protein